MRSRRRADAAAELGFEETKTARFLADKLKSFGVKVETEVGLTGLVATIQGRRPLSGAKPRSVGLRADMDALPMQEAQHGREYESRTPGIFHGCGHDGHMTMLLAAARQLAGAPDFAGTVHCIFQPAEEGRGGALKMIEDGLFERFPCDEIYAMHNWPGMPAGRIDAQPGPRMASSDNFDITLTSRGGHAAMPHLCTDAILVGSHIVTALQTIPSRLVDPGASRWRARRADPHARQWTRWCCP
jgi:amidohydrolase